MHVYLFSNQYALFHSSWEQCILKPCELCRTQVHHVIQDNFQWIEVPSLYHKTLLLVKDKLSWAQTIAITTDGWTSRAAQSYITIATHFKNSEWNIESCVLQTHPLFEAHTGVNIVGVLTEAFAKWGIKLAHGHVPITSDNAAGMGVAAVEAGMKPHIKCFAHDNSGGTTGSENKSSTATGKIRRVVNFFHKSSTASH